MDDGGFFKKVKQIELVSKRLVDELLAGNYRSIFRGMGIEFDEVRDYVLGDDARLIDWNVTSRMGSPFTKTFREERELSLFLVVDISSSVAKGSGNVSKSEIILIVFAIFAVSAIKNNDMVGALFFSDIIERWVAPAKGKKHVLRLIHDLYTTEAKGRGTELISLYIPSKKQIHEVSTALKDEYGSASNIKSDITRNHVQDALVKTMQRLKLFRRTPERGLQSEEKFTPLDIAYITGDSVGK